MHRPVQWTFRDRCVVLCIILFFKIFLLLFISARALDPCTTATLIDDPHRSTGYVVKDRNFDNLKCDHNLPVGWYKFGNGKLLLFACCKTIRPISRTCSILWVCFQNDTAVIVNFVMSSNILQKYQSYIIDKIYDCKNLRDLQQRRSTLATQVLRAKTYWFKKLKESRSWNMFR